MLFIVILALVGVAFIALEVLLPGMVLGIAGGICSVASLVLCYTSEDLAGMGFAGRSLVAATVLIVSLVLIGLWLKYFHLTGFGSRFVLTPDIDSKIQTADDTLLGVTGIAKTDLRPSGRVSIEGLPKTCDVIAENGFIESGSSIEVIKIDGRRVFVRAVS
jgi:membrane-bound serine protease (ClpP class)